jgi:hypothetical protein
MAAHLGLQWGVSEGSIARAKFVLFSPPSTGHDKSRRDVGVDLGPSATEPLSPHRLLWRHDAGYEGKRQAVAHLAGPKALVDGRSSLRHRLKIGVGSRTGSLSPDGNDGNLLLY